MIFSTRLAIFATLICFATYTPAQPLDANSTSERAQLDSYQARLIANPLQADLIPAPNPTEVGQITHSKLQALDRLHTAYKTGLRPEFAFIDPSKGVATLTSGPSALGASCANALLFDNHQSLKTYFEPQQSLWMRVASPANAVLILDSTGSHADTRMEMFTDCTSAIPVKSEDDSFGLQARIGLPRENIQKTYYVRIQSLSTHALPVQLRLMAGSTITGRLQQDNGTNVRAAVLIFDSQQRYLGSNFSDESTGLYEIAVPELIAGVYLRTEKLAFETWLNSVYPSGICRAERALVNCALSAAQLIATPANTAVNLSPLALPDGAKLRGTVTVAAGSISSNIYIQGVTRQGMRLFSSYTDAVGRYEINGLFPEPVLLYASGGELAPVIHANLECPGPSVTDCPLEQAQQVNLQLGSPVSVNFVLRRSGGVKLLASNFGWNMEVGIFKANGVFVGSQRFFTSELFIPLAPGSYRFLVKASDSFARVLPNIDCVEPCFDELTTSVPIVVSDQVIEMPVFLRALPEIRIRMRDRISQLPITGFGFAYTLENNLNRYDAVESTQPEELRFLNLPAGSYHIFSGSLEHLDQGQCH